jgi:hypothetical protein
LGYVGEEVAGSITISTVSFLAAVLPVLMYPSCLATPVRPSAFFCHCTPLDPEKLRNPRLKKRENMLAKVAEVATCRNLRRGRHSFIMAVGFVSARHYSERLVAFLNDPDVDGQVLDTLIKMKAPSYTREVAARG